MGSVDWRTAAFATGPGDRDGVTRGITAACTAAGLDLPERVAWLPSPLHGAVAVAVIADPAVHTVLRAAGHPEVTTVIAPWWMTLQSAIDRTSR